MNSLQGITVLEDFSKIGVKDKAAKQYYHRCKMLLNIIFIQF